VIKVQSCLVHENAVKLAYSNLPIEKNWGETGPHLKEGSASRQGRERERGENQVEGIKEIGKREGE